MSHQDIIQQAVYIHTKKNRFVFSREDFINVVKFWFDNNKTKHQEIAKLLDKLSYSSANFESWWMSIFNTYSTNELINRIFQENVFSETTLLEFGQSPTKKVTDNPNFLFMEEVVFSKTNDLLWKLCFILFVLEFGSVMSLDKTDPKEYGKELGITVLPAQITPDRNRATTGFGSDNKNTGIWEEIPHEAMRKKFVLDTSSFGSEDCVDSKVFLTTAFNQFIVETYYDFEDDETMEIGGYKFPKIKSRALRNLIGVQETSKFENISADKNQPANFDVFWNNIGRKYASSQRITEILRLDIEQFLCGGISSESTATAQYSFKNIKNSYKSLDSVKPIFSSSLRFKFSADTSEADTTLDVEAGSGTGSTVSSEDADEKKDSTPKSTPEFYDLGFEDSKKDVSIQMMTPVTNELFTLIRVNEHLKLLNQAKIGKGAAEYLDLLTRATDLPSQLGNILLGPSEKRRY